jgi:hypothetical protein
MWKVFKTRIYYVLLLFVVGIWCAGDEGVGLGSGVWMDPWRAVVLGMCIYDILTFPYAFVDTLSGAEAATGVLIVLIEPRMDMFMLGWALFMLFVVCRVYANTRAGDHRVSYLALEMMQIAFVVASALFLHVWLRFADTPGAWIVGVCGILALPGGWTIVCVHLHRRAVAAAADRAGSAALDSDSSPVAALLHMALTWAGPGTGVLWVAGTCVWLVYAEETLPELPGALFIGILFFACAAAMFVYAMAQYRADMWIPAAGCSAGMHFDSAEEAISSYLPHLFVLLGHGIVPHAMLDRLVADLAGPAGFLADPEMRRTISAGDLLAWLRETCAHYIHAGGREGPRGTASAMPEKDAAIHMWRCLAAEQVAKGPGVLPVDIADTSTTLDVNTLYRAMRSGGHGKGGGNRENREKQAPMPRFAEFFAMIVHHPERANVGIGKEMLLGLLLDQVRHIDPAVAEEIATGNREKMLYDAIASCASLVSLVDAARMVKKM